MRRPVARPTKMLLIDTTGGSVKIMLSRPSQRVLSPGGRGVTLLLKITIPS